MTKPHNTVKSVHGAVIKEMDCQYPYTKAQGFLKGANKAPAFFNLLTKHTTMEKTAMQEVYDKLNSANVTIKELFNWLADNETRLIAKEREQIVEARMMDETCSLNNAEQYYSSKYEQK